jgi:hypothetical protein
MQLLAVSPQLERFVKSMRVVHAATPDTLYRRLPDGESELMVTVDDGPTRASLIGTRTHVLAKPTSHGARAIVLRFRRGGAHLFFGRPFSELTDEVVALDQLWAAPELLQLQAAGSQEVAPRAVVSSLLKRLTHAYEPAAERSVRRALQRIARARSFPRVPELAAEIGPASDSYAAASIR